MTPAEFERMRRRYEVRDDVAWQHYRLGRWNRGTALLAFFGACACAVGVLVWVVARG